jgi:hypothetical protein
VSEYVRREMARRTVDFLECVDRGGFNDVQDRNDLLGKAKGQRSTMLVMRTFQGLGRPTHIFADTSFAEEFEELELAEGPKTEHGVVEWSDLLDCDLAATRSVHGRADDAVCSFTDDIEDLVLCACTEGF